RLIVMEDLGDEQAEQDGQKDAVDPPLLGCEGATPRRGVIHGAGLSTFSCVPPCHVFRVGRSASRRRARRRRESQAFTPTTAGSAASPPNSTTRNQPLEMAIPSPGGDDSVSGGAVWSWI